MDNKSNNKSFSDYDKPYTMASPTVRFSMPEGEKLTPKESIDLLNTYKKASFNEESVEVVKEETKSNNETQLIDYKIIGEAFDCYIFVESDGEILIIDKHAAHERIIFEDLKKSRETNGSIASQSLILPITVLLSSDELSCASDFKDEFEAIGFEFNINENACDILSIPEAITASDAEALFVKMVGELLLGIGNPSITESIRQERALYQIACKAAIKGGRMYDKSITSWLVSRVFALPDITVCPHGRPIAFKLTKSELDKKFERLK